MQAATGWVQGYRVQATVKEHQIIVACQVSQDANDVGLYQSMVTATRDMLGRDGVTDPIGLLLVDAGYWCEDNPTGTGPDRLIATLKVHKQRRAARKLGTPPVTRPTTRHRLKRWKSGYDQGRCRRLGTWVSNCEVAGMTGVRCQTAGVVETWMVMGEQQTLVEVAVEPTASASAEAGEVAEPAPGKVLRDYQPGRIISPPSHVANNQRFCVLLEGRQANLASSVVTRTLKRLDVPTICGNPGWTLPECSRPYGASISHQRRGRILLACQALHSSCRLPSGR